MPAREIFDIGGHVLLLGAFVVIGGVYLAGIYGRFEGWWSWSPVVWLHYMTSPAVLGGTLAFLFGIFAVLLRGRLKRLWDWVHAALSTSSGGRKRGPDGEAETFRAEDAASATGANRQDPASKRTAQDGGASGVVARATYPWLTGIVGIAAVTLVAIVTLVVFFPEILGRVRIDTRLRALKRVSRPPASRSFQVTAQASDTRTTGDLITYWIRFDPEGYDSAAQARVTSREAGPVRSAGDQFIRTIARPLARVIFCYSIEYRIRDTEMQHKAAKVTQDWSRVFEGDDIRLGMAVWQSYELMRDLEEDLGDHKSDCAEALSRPTVRIFPPLGCDRKTQECREREAAEFDKKVNATLGLVDALRDGERATERLRDLVRSAPQSADP